MRERITITGDDYGRRMNSAVVRNRRPYASTDLRFSQTRAGQVSVPYWLISIRRIEHYDGENVTYRYQDHRRGEVRETIPAVEFIGRMIQHLPPKGFAWFATTASMPGRFATCLRRSGFGRQERSMSWYRMRWRCWCGAPNDWRNISPGNGHPDMAHNGKQTHRTARNAA